MIRIDPRCLLFAGFVVHAGISLPVARAQCLDDLLYDEQAESVTFFGASLAMESEHLVVGAMLGTGAEWGTGRLHLYRLSQDVWTPAQILLAPDGELVDMLGVSVDINDGSIISGAWWDADNGERSGSAYIFEDSGEGDFTFAAKLLPLDGVPEANFGRTVAIDGASAVVGAPLQCLGCANLVGGGSAAGSAYLFQRGADGTWSETAKIVPDDLWGGDRFGLSLDMDGTTVAIGAPWSVNERGKVYIFEIGDEGAVSQIQTIQPDSIDSGDQFGFDVALDGDQLVVGAYLDDELAVDGGSIWFYEKIDDVWTLVQGPVVDADFGGEGAELGVSVELRGGLALVGARYATFPDAPVRSGGVIAYRDQGSWQPVGRFTSDQPQTDSEFGWQTALGDDSPQYAAIAAHYEDLVTNDEGAVYVFDLDDPVCFGDVLGDINADGIVDGADLTILLGAWGVCEAPYCPSDLDGDGLVDGADLTILLGSWTSDGG